MFGNIEITETVEITNTVHMTDIVQWLSAVAEMVELVDTSRFNLMICLRWLMWLHWVGG
jgi:hypothetical protein